MEHLTIEGAVSEQFATLAVDVVDVAALCQDLTDSAPGAHMHLCGRSVLTHEDAPSNQCSAWQHVDMHPAKIPLTTENLMKGMYPVGHCEKGSVVYTISGGGKTLSQGAVQLTNRTYVIFDWSCCDMQVTDMAFQDGYIVCHGEGCKVTFTRCKFASCCVVCVERAEAVFIGCSFENSEGEGPRVSVYCHGTGSSASVSGGSLTGGDIGVLALSGAHVKVSHTTITGMTIYGVRSRDNCTMVVESCIIRDFPSLRDSQPHLSWCAGGMYFSNGCEVTLTGVTVQCINYGITCENGHACIADCTIRDIDNTCLNFWFSATGSVTGCRISEGHSVAGLHAMGKRTEVDVQNCTFLCSAIGCFASDKAVVRLRECKSLGNKAAYCSLSSAQVLVSSCESEGDQEVCDLSWLQHSRQRNTAIVLDEVLVNGTMKSYIC